MNGIKADPGVKMDPDAATPSGGYMDDEFYEDTGEMTVDREGPKKDVWLTRIPDWLYEAVSKWDDLAEGNDSDQVQIGEVCAFATTSGIDQSKPMRAFLNDPCPARSTLPSAFQLDPAPVSDTLLGNTYVFTEKDLPGFKGQGFGYGQFNRGGAQGSFGGVQDPKARVQKRSKFKKAIPKQTALIGHATRQYTAIPLETREFKDFSAARIKQAIQGSQSSVLIVDYKEAEKAETKDKLTDSFLNFKFTGTKPKAQQNKAARIPRAELIDHLHQLFDEYQYWPMKAIKQRTKQPEQYLKEVLADIAFLVKSGAFAINWKRLEVFDKARDMSHRQGETAPVAVGGESDGDDDMEDVL